MIDVNRRRQLLATLTAVIVAASWTSGWRQESAAQPPAGAVIEQVLGRWASAKGLQPGDVVISWRREGRASEPPLSGEIATSLDLRDVELEQAPRGTVVLMGRRGDATFEWAVLPGQWSLVARPVLTDPLLQLHSEALAHRTAGRWSDAAASWRKAASEAIRLSHPALASWLLGRAAGEMANGGVWAEADPLFESALQSIPDADTTRRCRVLTTWGRTFEARSDWKNALDRYARALELRRTTRAASLEEAYILGLIGNVHTTSGNLEAAAAALEQSRGLRDTLAPGSLELADSLVALGNLASRRRDLDRANAYVSQALEIQSRVIPDTLAIAYTVNLLGAFAAWKGDWPAAERFFGQAYEIRQKLAPGSRDVAISLMNLGGIARERADIATAADRFERALAIAEKVPGMPALDLASMLQNVGNTAIDRGDYARAEDYTRRALDIRLKLAPETLDTALSLGSMGVIAWNRGDAAASADYHGRALVIQQKLAPKSADTARTLSDLGLVQWKSGALAEARKSFDAALALLQTEKSFALQYGITLMNRGLIPLGSGNLAAAQADFARALEILDGSAPGSLGSSMALNNLADVETRRGALDKALDYHRRALAIRQAVAPSSADEAQSHHAIGSIERRRKALPAAAESFAKAIASLEAQGVRLGGSQDVQSGFSGAFTEYYEDLAATLIDLGRPADAFAVHERSRARTLLAMMSQRSLQFGSVDRALLTDYDRNRRETDRVYARLADLSPKRDSGEVASLLGRLRELRDDREALANRARAQNPQFAELQFPQTLDLQGATRALDPGTVALVYSIGKTRSFLFALHAPTAASPTGLAIFPLRTTDATLRTRVETLRRAVNPSNADRDRAVGGVAGRGNARGAVAPVHTQARELYDLLVKPAEALVAQSRRVLVLPDGALHSVPFGALMPSTPNPGKARYLIELKPIHLAASMTVYDSIKRRRRPQAMGASTLVAFGDPAYGAGADRAAGGATAPAAQAARRGLNLAPLPATRGEIQHIASRFADRATVLLGGDATEERAKKIAADVRYVHFAVHGFVDSRFPLNSALALAQPAPAAADRENGLLQVWEIFEQMRLDADLVTLSACETALGQELGGEGLLGLTRAFHYAGARSIVASLWSVADESTSDLMTRFYAHLTSGTPKDEALRAAQLELLRGAGEPNGAARFSHLFHWAAFQTYGDWR